MKILIIKTSLSAGGVDNLVMNQIPYLYEKGYEIWIQYLDGVKEQKLDFYQQYKCNFIKLPSYKKGIQKFINEETKVFEKGNFDIIHSHICQFSYLVLLAAKKAKINNRIICHSHYDDYYRGWPYLRLFMPMIYKQFNKSNCILVASSQASGKALFGNNKFCLIYNGIDTQKFQFSISNRSKIREQLGINNEIAICNVGMFRDQKNHIFLLDIFNECLKIHENSILVLIGAGPLEDEIKEKAKRLNIFERIRFLGVRHDVNELLNGMDLCFFPTKYEGFSMNLIELQCNGLPTICSDVAPNEIKIVDSFTFFDLNKSAMDWAKIGLQLYNNTIRKDQSQELIEKKLDISSYNEEMDKIYQNEANRFINR